MIPLVQSGQKAFAFMDSHLGSFVKSAGGFSLADLNAYWKFNEASGNIINQASSIGSTDMIASTDIVITGATYGVTGILGEALSFVTNDSGITSGASASVWNYLNQNGAIFTIAIWYKWDDRNDTGALLSTGAFTTGNSGVSIYLVAPSRKIGFSVGTEGDDGFEGTTTITVPDDGNWHLIIWTYDDSTGDSILSINDGTKEVSGSHNLTNTATCDNLKIAVFSNDTEYFNGDLDEISIWNRVLTDEEQTILYNSGLGHALP